MIRFIPTPFPVAARRPGRADFPHPALSRIMPSPTEGRASSPSGVQGPGPKPGTRRGSGLFPSRPFCVSGTTTGGADDGYGHPGLDRPCRPVQGGNNSPLSHMPSPLPRRNPGGTVGCLLRSSSPTAASFPVSQSGRLPHCPSRGLPGVHCSLRPMRSLTPLRFLLRQKLQPLRYLRGRSDHYRLERLLPGGIRTHWDRAPLHGTLRYPG